VQDLDAVATKLMEAVRFVAIFVSLSVSLFIVFFLVLSGKHWRAEQDRARERRIAEHRMNARLLRLNI